MVGHIWPENSLQSQKPIKILYNNDLVNITLGNGDWRLPDSIVTKELIDERIRISVNEVADHQVDVHILSLGQGWIPIWRSAIYPAKTHYENWEQKTGKRASVWGQYMKDTINHGDLLQVYMEACNALPKVKRPLIFVSMRLNDIHFSKAAQKDHDIMVDLLDNPQIWHPYTEWIHDSISNNWIRGNDSLFLKPLNPREPNRRAINWLSGYDDPDAFSALRMKLLYINEVCTRYEIEGLELDFMRFYQYFDLNETTQFQRIAVMKGFISEVKQILDKNGIKWLCLRIPVFRSVHDQLGIDINTFEGLGVNMVVLSTDFWLMQQGILDDLAYYKRQLPHIKLYQELHYSTFWDATAVRNERILAYKEQLFTSASLGYDLQLDGLALFNFKYFQTWTSSEKMEKVFGFIDTLSDVELLKEQPVKWYFKTMGWNNPVVPDQDRPLPFVFNNPAGLPTTYHNQIHINLTGVPNSGYFRMFFREEFATYADRHDTLNKREWQVILNEDILVRTDNIYLNFTKDIYNNKYHFPRGGSDYTDPGTDLQRVINYKVSPLTAHNGINSLSITQLSDGGKDQADVHLYYYDLILFFDP